MKKVCCSFPLLLALSGCAWFGGGADIKPGSAVTLAPDEGLVIVGVPKGTEIVFQNGYAVGETFLATSGEPEAISGKAERGYVVRRFKATGPGRGYGMVMVRTEYEYGPGCGQDLAVLSVEAGKVQYYGDFAFVGRGTALKIRYDHDLRLAAERFAADYPAIRMPVIEGKIRQLKRGECVQDGRMLPVPIPARRMPRE